MHMDEKSCQFVSKTEGLRAEVGSYTADTIFDHNALRTEIKKTLTFQILSL